MVAPFSPQAFYPYFTNYEDDKDLHWLEWALEILKLCDAIYVYTEDGFETEQYVSKGMCQCIDKARQLGMEVQFRQPSPVPNEWKPKKWEPHTWTD